MAFQIHSTEDGRVPSIYYLPASAIQMEIGLALVQSGGNLIKAQGAVTPTYISMCQTDSAVTAGDIVPVIRVLPDTIYETEASASMSSIKLGDKVTVATDGLRVTGTTTDGVAEVVALDGTTSGSKVRVRFG